MLLLEHHAAAIFFSIIENVMVSSMLYVGAILALVLSVVVGGGYFSAHGALTKKDNCQNIDGTKTWIMLLLIVAIVALLAFLGCTALIVHQWRTASTLNQAILSNDVLTTPMTPIILQ